MLTLLKAVAKDNKALVGFDKKMMDTALVVFFLGIMAAVKVSRASSIDLPLFVIGDFSHDAEYSARVDAAIEADPRVVAHRSLLPRDELLDVVRGTGDTATQHADTDEQNDRICLRLSRIAFEAIAMALRFGANSFGPTVQLLEHVFQRNP